MQVFQLVPKAGRERVNVFRRDMRFSPDGRYLHVPSDSVNFLDTQGDQPPKELADIVYGFTPDGARTIGCCNQLDGELLVVNLKTGKRLTRVLKDCVVAHGAV